MRVRTLVNPFSVRDTLAPANFSEIFENPNLPVDLEIGTGQGNFFMQLCANRTDRNHVGVELRYGLAVHVNQKIQQQGLKNGKVFYGNVHHCLENIINGHILAAIYIFFPDPWEKRRHANRRLLSLDLVQRLVKSLQPGGRIYVQTDVVELLQEMRQVFDQVSGLKPVHPEVLCPPELWRNEIGEIFSNRERDAMKTNLPIYRLILQSIC